MRAAVVDRYGPPSVIRVREVPDPAPGRGEVLVRVTAASVNSGDARIRAARFPSGMGVGARLALGIRGPRGAVLGVAYAGVVEALGPGAGPGADPGAGPGISVGDRIAGMTGMRMGAHAELAVVPAARAVPIPEGVSDADAVGSIFGGTTALYFLRDRAKLASGQTVLVNGAAGSVGSAAVQLARGLGAHVTAVTRSANADLVRRLGAERTIDYTRTPLDTLDERFDVVFDTVGNVDIAGGRRLLAPGGALLLAVAGLGQMLRARGAVHAGTSPERPEDIAHLLALVATGSFDPLVDIVGGLDAVALAHERIDSGHKTGNLVVQPQA